MRFKFDKTTWLLAAIIVFGMFLRFFRLPELFYYTMDEEVMNLIQRQIATGVHFPLIGSVSPLSTYLGPYFYYLGAVILWLSGLNPLGQSIFGCILGGVNISLVYLVASRLFNKTTGMIASLIYSISFLQVIFDRRYWHLSLGPFYSILILWSLYKIKNGSLKFVYLLTAVLIMGWNTDYTNLVLFLFVFIAWILFKLPIKRKEIAISLVIFLISNLPLVIFDFRHDFLNTKSFVGYFSKHKQSIERKEEAVLGDRDTLGGSRGEQMLLTVSLPFITLSRLIYTNSDPNIAEQHTYCKSYIFDRNNSQGTVWPFISGLLLIAFGFVVYKKRREKVSFNLKLIISFYLIFQLGVIIYAFGVKGDVFEHYLATLLPVFAIILGVLLDIVYKSRFRLLVVALLIFFVLANVSLILRSYNPFGFYNKMEATKYALSHIGDSEFGLDSLGSCYRYDGYYYPFILQGRHPVKSYQDGNYSWLYDYKTALVQPSKIVVMVSEGRFEKPNFYETLNKYEKFATASGRFGGIRVLIIDNSKGEFK